MHVATYSVATSQEGQRRRSYTTQFGINHKPSYEAMSHINALDQELNDMILQGKILEAFDKFYADDVVMKEDDTERVGKEANREYEEQFVEALEEFHAAEIVSRAVDEENHVTLSEWHNEMTLDGVGRVEQKQVSVRTWNEDGQITSEKFYKLG
jgi:antitoxin component YwqK of YwqJK toxin-antitoxin module